MKNKKVRGIWKVYDLEANKTIQNLLHENRFNYEFNPNEKILIKRITKEIFKKIKNADKCPDCKCKERPKCIQQFAIDKIKKEFIK